MERSCRGVDGQGGCGKLAVTHLRLNVYGGEAVRGTAGIRFRQEAECHDDTGLPKRSRRAHKHTNNTRARTKHHMRHRGGQTMPLGDLAEQEMSRMHT